jgi:hypothetical protein
MLKYVQRKTKQKDKNTAAKKKNRTKQSLSMFLLVEEDGRSPSQVGVLQFTLRAGQLFFPSEVPTGWTRKDCLGQACGTTQPCKETEGAVCRLSEFSSWFLLKETPSSLSTPGNN